MAFYFVSTFAIAQTPTKQPALRLSRTKNLHFAKAPFPGFSALVADYLSFVDINYPILIAESDGAKLSQQLGNTVSAIPFTAIVNQQQQIIFYHPGELSKQRLTELIKPLLSSQP